MENETEIDRGKLYSTVTKGIQVIRNGLRNIASAPDRQLLLTKYLAPVSAKYNISCSRLPNQPESKVTIAALGHGFPKLQIQQQRQELVLPLHYTVNTKIVRINAELSSKIHLPGQELSEADDLVTKLGLATINDPRIILNNLQPKREPCSDPQRSSAKSVSATSTTTDKECERSNILGSAKTLSIHSDYVGINVTSTETALQQSYSPSKTEEMSMKNTTRSGKDVSIYCKNTMSNRIYTTLVQESTYIQNDTTSAKVSNEESEQPLTKTDSENRQQDCHEDILSSKQAENNNINDLEYAVPSDVSESAISQDISSPAQDLRDNHNDLDVVPSQKPSPNITTYANEVHPKSCSETISRNTESTVTSTNVKRRPRPRRSNLNTDRKMWMSKKSSRVQEEQDTGSRCQITQKHELDESCSSPEDMLIKIFGYDPSDDVFLNTRTNKALPKSLTDVKIEIFRRQEIQFYKNDEDEFSIVSEGASCILYLASKDGKDILVKDSSKSSRSADDVLKEARILSNLNERGVVPCFYGVLEQGLLEKEYSIVHENCDGFLTLTQLLKSGYYLSRKDWMEISLSLSGHLKILHSHRVLHNNICSDNILVNMDSLEVKLVGFSQASYGKGVKLPRAARQHQGISPEVKYGCITSPYSDVYALGSVLEQVMVESRVMDLHEVVLLNHQDLPRDRPQAEKIFSMIQYIYSKLC